MNKETLESMLSSTFSDRVETTITKTKSKFQNRTLYKVLAKTKTKQVTIYSLYDTDYARRVILKYLTN